MGCDENDSTAAEVLDFETGRQRKKHEAACDEVDRQLTRLLAGDREAASWLYDTFSPSLYRRLRQRYGHLEGIETDDLLHDAFVFYFQRDAKVLRDFMQRYEREGRSPARLERHLWDLACGVASNRRRHVALRDRRRRSRPLADEEEVEDDAQEKLLLDRDELERLDACLRGHGSRIYLYFKLRFCDGYSPAEIAEITGWSRKAIYKLRQSLTNAVRSCAELLGIPLSTRD